MARHGSDQFARLVIDEAAYTSLKVTVNLETRVKIVDVGWMVNKI